MPTTIYHNPKCGTSRNTLALLNQCQAQPRVIEYLQMPPTRDELKSLIETSGLSVRGIMREKEALFAELKLGEATDEDRLDAMMSHPILINRPIVVTSRGTRLCRPSEVVLDILEEQPVGPFTKEDGEQVLDAQGQRVKSQ